MKNQLPIKDKLALDRTKLANERTFLAYFRTSVVFLSSGFAIFKLDSLKDIKDIGLVLIVMGPLLLIIGVIRFYITKKRMISYTNNHT